MSQTKPTTEQLHVSVRDSMLSDARKEGDASSTFEALGAIGAAAIELVYNRQGALPAVFDSQNTAYSIASDAELRSFRDRLKNEKVKVSALLLATDFCGAESAAHVDWTLASLAAAEALGAPAVRIDATHWGELPVETVRERCIHCITSIFDQSPGSKVDLGIENHGKISNDPEYLDALFAAVPNPRLGLTLDIGNFYWRGYPLDELYGVIEHFAPRARHTHIKSINYPPDLARQQRPVGFEYRKYCSPLDEGNLDLPRIVRLLHAAGYRRGLCIENEGLGKFPADERMAVLRRDVAAVKDAIEATRGSGGGSSRR